MVVASVAPETPPVVVRLQQALALFRQGRMDEAESLYASILVDDPGNPHALHLMGLIAERRGDYDMAEQLIWRSIQMEPHSRAYLNLGVVQQHRGHLNEGIASYRAAINLEPDYAEAWANLIFAIDMHPHASPELLQETRRAFDAAICSKLTALSPPHENDRDPDRKLRVGYVSGDFRLSHSAAMSLGWIAAHDPEQVEVYLYSTYEGTDPTDAPFRARADVWSEVGHLAPHELAHAIREDRIDILVDLGGVSKGGRPLAFALKPAPIQVAGWGYGHGLGISAMDYLIGDAVAIPPEHADRYAERVLRLPAILGYALHGTVPAIGPPPQSRNGYRTYGYLGRPIKLNDACLAAWAEILRRDPTGRLLLKSGQYHDRTMRERVVDALGALGVSMDRIEIQGVTSRYEHLEAHNDVDVCLDSFPQSGGMTTMDALLMGVPVVTVAGDSLTRRASASILTVIGEDAYVCDSIEEYIYRVVDCSLPPQQQIRDALLGSIMVDVPRYARTVEDQYRAIWRAWCSEAA